MACTVHGAGSGAALLAALLLVAMPPAAASELPKRKPGLWSIQSGGTPLGPQSVEQCVDGKTDNLWQHETPEGTTCTKPVIRRDGNRYRVAMQCSGEGHRQTMEGEYTMQGDTGFSGHNIVKFTPAMAGMSELKMSVEGKWLGTCKPGMKPGDVVVQGGLANPFEGKDVGSMSAEELQKAAQDLLKQMQQKR